MDLPPNTSLIETMHASPSGDIALIDLHLDRLLHSAQTLGYAHGERKDIKQQIENHLCSRPPTGSEQRIRLLMSEAGEVTIESYPLPPLIGLPLVAVSALEIQSHEPLLQHKTTYRPWYADTPSWLLSHPDFFDLIFLNENQEVCEGSRSNVYLWQDGVWVTPPLRCGLLGGVLRRQLLESGQVVEKPIPVSALHTDPLGLRLSNGLRGWFDVRLVPFPGDMDRNS